MKSGYRVHGKPSTISSLKRGAKNCEYPKCDKEARYMGIRKGTKHFFCVTHFNKYYGTNY